MKAKDVMTTEVVYADPESSVRAIARTLLKHRISGVPVADHDGRVIGIVSEGDLMRRPESETVRPRSWWLELMETPEDRASQYLKSHGLTARDVMTREPITVAEDTPLEEIAMLLEQKAIKRVPVLRDGKLVGIVSRADLLHGLVARAGQARAGPACTANARSNYRRDPGRGPIARLRQCRRRRRRGTSLGRSRFGPSARRARPRSQAHTGVTRVESHLVLTPP